MVSSLVVADRLIELAKEEDDTLTPMQLIKLVYLCHGWMLGLYGVPLISDQIEAWKYGPVIPTLYHAVKGYRDQPVTRQLARRDLEGLTELQDDLVRQVYRAYGRRSGIALSSLTHKEGTPWFKTYKPSGWGLKISDDLIEEHYQELAERYGSEE